MAKKNALETVKDARNALQEVGKRLEKVLGGEERGLALKAVSVADKCLNFQEKELDKFMNPKTREASLLVGPTDITRTFKDAMSILSLFAGVLKKTEEAERDLERGELQRRTVEALEKVGGSVPPVMIPEKEDNGPAN